MKRYSLFSHFFWISAAVVGGVLVFYSATKGAELVYGSFNQPEQKNSGIFFSYDRDRSSQIETQTTEAPPKKIKELKISSESYLVADAETGKIISNKNENSIMPIASITKLMTALVSLETIDQFQKTKISSSAASVPSIRNGDLREGQSAAANELLYPLLMESSNVAAEALAEISGRQNFISKMNEQATLLGMSGTTFADPSGLSQNNVSTAGDVLKLISHILKNKNYILKATQKKEHQTDQGVWSNNNKFSGMENYLGGKTGYTELAGKTFAGIFSAKTANGETKKIAVILLKSKDRDDDVIKILDYLKER